MLTAALLLLAAAPQQVTGPPSDATVSEPEVAADGTQRWSILVDPCASVQGDGTEIVVCGAASAENPRLPLPAERGPPDRPVPSNPYLTGSGALAATIAPCPTRSEGCTTGLDLFGGGTFLVRAIGKIVDPDSCCEEPGEATRIDLLGRDAVRGVKGLFRKKPDKSKRIPIPLDDPAPVTAPPPAPQVEAAPAGD